MQDKKGKRRAIEAVDFGPDQGAVEVLLELLGKSLCRRSASHQEQVLQLLVILLNAAKQTAQFIQEVLSKTADKQASADGVPAHPLHLDALWRGCAVMWMCALEPLESWCIQHASLLGCSRLQ